MNMELLVLIALTILTVHVFLAFFTSKDVITFLLWGKPVKAVSFVLVWFLPIAASLIIQKQMGTKINAATGGLGIGNISPVSGCDFGNNGGSDGGCN